MEHVSLDRQTKEVTGTAGRAVSRKPPADFFVGLVELAQCEEQKTTGYAGGGTKVEPAGSRVQYILPTYGAGLIVEGVSIS